MSGPAIRSALRTGFGAVASSGPDGGGAATTPSSPRHDTAVDVAWSVLSPSTRSRLVVGCGWPAERSADRVADAVDRLLLR